MTQSVRIYQPAKTAMQSGRARTHGWVLEFDPNLKRGPEPLMGWISGGTTAQVRLKFETKAEALAYAEKQGFRVDLMEPHDRKLRPKSYADNFRPERIRT
jgi:hypothetical protein